MTEKNLMLIDAVTNLALGVLLGIFPKEVIQLIGISVGEVNLFITTGLNFYDKCRTW